MKVELFPFQKTALLNLRREVAGSLGSYRRTRVPQVVSYTAPTGAGKTIIMSSLIESIFAGDNFYPDQPDAVFVWLSDSPQLNEQSKNKIDIMADLIRLDQCVTISDDSFDIEVLEDGHIYFLNTQKLGANSNLTKHSDGRQHTIWETLQNTVRDKSDRFYFIIDEAHRGAQKPTEMARANTIMQKFLMGSPKDNLEPMPVVIGMTATSERFNRLAQGINSTVHNVVTTPNEVRASGLLKDRIVITYPETTGNDMAVLQAASDEWKNKCDHWRQYCVEQHEALFNPVFVIQVQNGTGHQISATDLNECLRIIEERTGERFVAGEVAHAFGDASTLIINGLEVQYVEPSRIADDKRIRVVFFKETLSTGWDCPRAETMMSFRKAIDHTYIAQLLGRMVRTPLQRHIQVDESLNDVHLFLPQFDEQTVYDVVKALQDAEGANIPTDIDVEPINKDGYETWSLRPTYQTPPRSQGRRVAPEIPGQISFFDPQQETEVNNTPPAASNSSNRPTTNENRPAVTTPQNIDLPKSDITERHGEQTAPLNPVEEAEQPQNVSAPRIDETAIDREAVVKAVNDAGLLTYHIRHVRINDYLKSLYALARFFYRTAIDLDARNNIIDDITQKIREHIDSLRRNGLYEGLANDVMTFKLNAQVFDVFGETVQGFEVGDLLSTTDTDIDRQYRLAENKLGNEGVANAYVRQYSDEEDIINLKIQVIIYAADAACMSELQQYAEVKFHSLNDTYRRRTVSLPDREKKKYDDIVSDGDLVSAHNFRLPESIRVPHETEGVLYSNHLFVDDSGTAMINLNGWERKVIEEEQKREDFVCWIRNPSRGSWALCIPYEIDNETRPMYPDFLIVRQDMGDYIVDVLEPHNPTFADNLGKARGLAAYARNNPGMGRIELIRMKDDSLGNERPFRLDMSQSLIRNRVLECLSIGELNHVFDEYGRFD